MTRFSKAAILALMLSPATVFAGPVSEFESEFRVVYQSYRMALFQTNTGQVEPSAKALAGFVAKWAALTARYGQTPPPHYADDPKWKDAIAAVDHDVTTAKAQVAAGDLAAAHETLENVRDEIGALHARNGIETFSDRMNAYHSEMEHVLAIDLREIGPNTLQDLLERAAVLAYLAQDVLDQPPAEAEGNTEYTELAQMFRASVSGFQAAARTGDADAIRAAVSGLKKPYSKLFLKFG